MSDKNYSDEFALIESIVTDQGNGSSSCSKCNANIDIFNIEKLKDSSGEWRCPNCKRILSFGDVWINRGGSDF